MIALPVFVADAAHHRGDGEDGDQLPAHAIDVHGASSIAAARTSPSTTSQSAAPSCTSSTGSPRSIGLRYSRVAFSGPASRPEPRLLERDPVRRVVHVPEPVDVGRAESATAIPLSSSGAGSVNRVGVRRPLAAAP